MDLVGYCAEPPMVVYEYMEQGNLFDRLFAEVSGCISFIFNFN